MKSSELVCGTRRRVRTAAPALLLSLLILGNCALLGGCESRPRNEETANGPGSAGAGYDSSDSADTQEESAAGKDSPVAVTPLARPQFLNFPEEQTVRPSVPSYTVSAGLPEVVNTDQFDYLSESELEKLEKNLFVVRGGSYEFFEQYEMNRYGQTPNFVTVDSLMHTYHLYFSLLLSRTEKKYLAADLAELSASMLDAAEAQYEALAGTEWEEAALKNVAFFSVGASLQNEGTAVADYAASIVKEELGLIYAADGIHGSPVADDLIDYTQFKPRGYYDGDKTLEAYFRTMMWYGQIPFVQKNDTLNRAAMLIMLNLAVDSGLWENIYTVTAFFAGCSDDLSYYEYLPAIQAAYGRIPEVSALAGDEEGYNRFVSIVSQLDPPAINSVPAVDDAEDGVSADDVLDAKKGFRFMGQRFTIDAAIMQQLVYRAVEQTADGEKRMLPDALDIPAALGSEAALGILLEKGEGKYPNFSRQMEKVRGYAEEASPAAWTSSLSSSWLYTLLPVLEPKEEGYPSYMSNAEWQKKCLETFTGSYTELKHDTVLYAKQVMAEFGGGLLETYDDRGYVDPEIEIYQRFVHLAEQTASGLDRLGFLTESDRENLSRLAELARNLVTISEKELRNETLADDEYDLIRNFGGTL